MRKSQQIVSVLFLFWSISLFLPSRNWAAEAVTTSSSALAPLPSANEKKLVQVRVAGSLVAEPEWTYIVCHGMWGTTAGDRFERLCVAIKRQLPQCNVVLLDWSDASKSGSGVFMAWHVAKHIDPVADAAAEQLKALSLDRTRTTLIGESFGNYVNARLAKHLGGCERILAFNPASELGGYTPPDLKAAARAAWSFHTYSVFDTTLEIAESGFWLETPAGASHWEQHVAGIAWLLARLEAGDPSWLHMNKELPPRRAGHFQASATMDGMLLNEQPPRERPLPTDASKSSTDLLTPDATVAPLLMQ